MSPDDPRHGTYAGGRVHRRASEPVCEACRLAEARYENQRRLDIDNGRPRTLLSLGTRRRIQALVALGHTFGRIGEALDVTAGMASALAHRPTYYVRATTAAKVDSLYDAWSMRLPPATTPLERRNAKYARTVATKHGWAPPLAWDDIDNDLEPADAGPTGIFRELLIDHAVVERVLAGDPRPRQLTRAEAAEICRRLLARGMSTTEIEVIYGLKTERYTTARTPGGEAA